MTKQHYETAANLASALAIDLAKLSAMDAASQILHGENHKFQLSALARYLGYNLTPIEQKTKDTFANWHALDESIRFIARDKYGEVFGYDAKPVTDGVDAWQGPCAFGISDFITGHTPGTCDWTESLIERPTGGDA